MSTRIVARRAVACAILAALAAPAVQATESIFADTYLVDTQPAGGHEFEQWFINKRGKASGEYNEWYLRSEVEFGITDKLQIAPYVNVRAQNVYRTTADGRTEADYVPEDFSYDHPFERYRKTQFDSVSAEVIYRFTSPVTDALGVALYVEPSIGPRFRELEARLLLQKNLVDDRLILAGNLGVELEDKKKTGVPGQIVIPGEGPEEGEGDGDDDEGDVLLVPRWDRSTEVIGRFGASYLFAPRWRVGAELSGFMEYEGRTLSSSKREHLTWFFGPTIAYADQHFFFSATLEHQMPWAKVYEDEYAAEKIGGRLYANERERNVFTFKFGMPF